MRVLIATDGSDFSKAAVIRSCEFIKPEFTEIKIVSAYEDPMPIASEPFIVSADYYQQVEDALRSNAEENVSHAAQELKSRFPGNDLDLTTEILRGPPDKLIVEKAAEWRADLIVVGSHGRGFWGRMLGSVSDGVVHHSPCSVLVVRTAAV